MDHPVAQHHRLPIQRLNHHPPAPTTRTPTGKAGQTSSPTTSATSQNQDHPLNRQPPGLSVESGPVIRRLAEQLNVHPEALRNWIRQAEADAGERDDRPTTAMLEENRRLARENAELRRVNEVLRAASAYFASEIDPTRRRS